MIAAEVGDAVVELSCQRIGDVQLVALQEESLDVNNIREFKRAMTPHATLAAKIVLDLSRVQFVDSTGCGALLSFLRELRGVGGELKLCGMTKPVRSLFQLVRMNKVFDIHKSKEDAVMAFQPSPSTESGAS